MTDNAPRAPHFYRSRDRKFLGVCGGIADYFGWDPLFVRVAVAVSLFFSGGAVLIGYFAIAFFAPCEPRSERSRAEIEARRAENRDYWRRWARSDHHWDHFSYGAAGWRGRRPRGWRRRFGADYGAQKPMNADDLGDGAAKAASRSAPAAEKAEKGGEPASESRSRRIHLKELKRRFAEIDDQVEEMERAVVSGDLRLRKAFKDLEQDDAK